MLLLDVGEDAVELVEAVVAHDQFAPSAGALLDGDLGAELLGEVLLEAQHVRVPRRGHGLARARLGSRD